MVVDFFLWVVVVVVVVLSMVVDFFLWVVVVVVVVVVVLVVVFLVVVEVVVVVVEVVVPVVGESVVWFLVVLVVVLVQPRGVVVVVVVWVFMLSFSFCVATPGSLRGATVMLGSGACFFGSQKCHELSSSHALALAGASRCKRSPRRSCCRASESAEASGNPSAS